MALEPEDPFTYPLPLGGKPSSAEVSRLVLFGADDLYAILLVETADPFRHSGEAAVGEIDGETVLRIDVEADRSQRYESRFDGKMRTFVRVEGSAKALEGQDLINWWDRRRTIRGAPR